MKTKGIEPILERRANRQHGRTQNTRKPNQQQEKVHCPLCCLKRMQKRRRGVLVRLLLFLSPGVSWAFET